MPSTFLDVDPRELRLPSSSASVDPFKLQQQITRFGGSATGMPPIWVYEGSDGVFVISNGITRASRIAKLAPGTLVRVEVVGGVRVATFPRSEASCHDQPCTPGHSPRARALERIGP